jgi:hypothetical protein
MKTRVVRLILFALGLSLALPARGGIVYENGPIDGQDYAWLINLGGWVTDTFTVSGGATTFTGLSLGAWLSPGDTLISAEVLMTSNRDGGTIYFDQTVAFFGSGCFTNQYEYRICTEAAALSGPTLANETYWLKLQNATTTLGGQAVWWDQNSGVGCHSPNCPSQAWDSEDGPIPSESFSLSGSEGGTTPEPGSVLLFGSGIIGVAGLRRKVF